MFNPTAILLWHHLDEVRGENAVQTVKKTPLNANSEALNQRACSLSLATESEPKIKGSLKHETETSQKKNR